MSLLEQFLRIIQQVLPEPHAGLLSGIVFGFKATLDPAFKQALITTGTLHIVALSGMNITILIALVNTTLLRYVKRPIANIGSILLIIGFICLVGISPSVVRAAIMGSVTLIAVSFGRQVWSIWIWLLAVVVMLVLNPLWATDISFQLSILATLGIILFGKTNARYRFPWSLIADDLRITLAAQVFTIPLMIFQFHRISFVSPLSNILIGWLIAPVTISGFVIVLLGLLWMPLAYASGWVSWLMLEFIIQAIQLTAMLPFASMSW